MTTQPSALPLYMGYDWLIPVMLTDTATGAPLDISTWTISGDLWLPGQSLTSPTVIPAQDIDVPNAKFRFFVPRTLTQVVRIQGLDAQPPLCRLLVNYSDGAGDKIALRPISIRPLDPRTSTL